MRAVLFAVAIIGALGALGAPSPAKAWHDRWGRWHPNHGYPVYYRHYYAPYHHHYYWHHRSPYYPYYR